MELGHFSYSLAIVSYCLGRVVGVFFWAVYSYSGASQGTLQSAHLNNGSKTLPSAQQFFIPEPVNSTADHLRPQYITLNPNFYNTQILDIWNIMKHNYGSVLPPVSNIFCCDLLVDRFSCVCVCMCVYKCAGVVFETVQFIFLQKLLHM